MGQGSAAFAAAIKANEMGVSTVMIGHGATSGSILGGTCINVGCVPSKRLITVSTFMEELRKRRYSGLQYEIGKIEYDKIIAEKNKLVGELREQKYKDVLEGMENVTFMDQLGKFADANTVVAGAKEIHSKNMP